MSYVKIDLAEIAGTCEHTITPHLSVEEVLAMVSALRTARLLLRTTEREDPPALMNLRSVMDWFDDSAEKPT